MNCLDEKERNNKSIRKLKKSIAWPGCKVSPLSLSLSKFNSVRAWEEIQKSETKLRCFFFFTLGKDGQIIVYFFLTS